jgi:hypothetical protein
VLRAAGTLTYFVLPAPLELPLPEGDEGLIAPGVPVVPPLPTVPPALPPAPVLPGALVVPEPLVLLPELAPPPRRWSRRQSSFCKPVSESQRALPEPLTPELLLPLIPVLPLAPVLPDAPVLPEAPVLLLPLVPALPLAPVPPLELPEVCAIDTVAAPTSAAVTAAHSIFIIIVKTPR